MPADVQGLRRLRKEAGLRSQPEPLDGGHEAPLQPEPPAGSRPAPRQADPGLRLHPLPEEEQGRGAKAPAARTAEEAAAAADRLEATDRTVLVRLRVREQTPGTVSRMKSL